MEQLKKAYEAIEMLNALGLPVSDEQLQGVAKLEKEYLQKEIIPLLKQELEPMTNRLKNEFHIEVIYDKGSGLLMNIIENTKGGYNISAQQGKSGTRDTTKYSIDGGEPLKKRRFVLAVVKKYVEANKGITYEELKRRFPDRLSNSLLHGVIRPYEKIKEKLNTQPDLEKRFFLDEEDLIKLSDGMKLTVYNQWGTHFPYFLEVARQLYTIECFKSN